MSQCRWDKETQKIKHKNHRNYQISRSSQGLQIKPILLITAATMKSYFPQNARTHVRDTEPHTPTRNEANLHVNKVFYTINTERFHFTVLSSFQIWLTNMLMLSMSHSCVDEFKRYKITQLKDRFWFLGSFFGLLWPKQQCLTVIDPVILLVL